MSYVENGLGLFGFNTIKLNYINFLLFKNKIKKENFKGFVFYSKAARESTKRIFLEMGCIHLFLLKILGLFIHIHQIHIPTLINMTLGRLIYCFVQVALI